MEVGSVSSASQALSGATSQELGKEEFLELLVAQLEHQDPLNPVDDKEFISQLAQFSSLEQAIQSNVELEQLNQSQRLASNNQAASMVGYDVVARSDRLFLENEGQQVPLFFTLPAAAENVSIRVMDETGTVVRSMELGRRPAGSHGVSWDGVSNEGVMLPPGVYRYDIAANDDAGSSLATTSEISGTVRGVDFSSGVAELLVGDLRVRLGDIMQVLRGSSTDTATKDQGE